MKKALLSLLAVVFLLSALSALGADQAQDYTVNGQPLQDMTYMQLMDLRDAVNENVYKAIVRQAKAMGFGDGFLVINTNTKKFHEPTCKAILDIDKSNMELTDRSAQQLEAEHYNRCKLCVPD